MYPEPHVHEVGDTPRRRRRRHNQQPGAETESERLRLASVDGRVDVSDALNRPMIAMVLTEDLCWQSFVSDWRSRRPSWWQHRERAVWRAEGAQLQEKKARIRALAVEAGVVRE